MELNATLRKLSDARLKPGMCYGGNENCPITLGTAESFIYGIRDDKSVKDSRPGKLVYQDGTACSSSYFFHDIYLLDDGSYNVYMDCGQSICLGGNYEKVNGIKEYEHFNSLAEVLDYLVGFCGHGPNTTGNLLIGLIDSYRLKLDDSMTLELEGGGGTISRRIPILSNCNANKKLIEVIDFLSRNSDKHACLSEFEEQYGYLEFDRVTRLPIRQGNRIANVKT